MSPHLKRVMGIALLKELGYMYSVSEDGKFKITELNSQSVVTEITPGKSSLQNLELDLEHNRFIISDGDGKIYIYSSNTVISFF